MSAEASSSTSTSTSPNWLPAKSARHFFAGGLGGMCGAVVTSPFDVVKTRLQSSLFREKQASVGIINQGGSAVMMPRPHRPGGLLYNFVETGHILRDIYYNESPRALFKGLGPTLIGVIPARSINFFTYGNGKQIIANTFYDGQENTYVYLGAAAIAGVATGTATNPIWVVKTRLQLEAADRFGVRGRQASFIGGSMAVIKNIAREEGIKGFYKGLSASYLGVTETVIQWVLYERLKKLNQQVEWSHPFLEWCGMLGSAGAAKGFATVFTYPHEVVRTRLRQAPIDGVKKYHGLLQSFKLVLAEEGAKALYGGLSAHLMRVVPNAAIMYTVYEGLLRW